MKENLILDNGLEILRTFAREHQNILLAVELLEKECLTIEQGKEVDKEFFEGMSAFIGEYADEFHHAKEEDLLFKEVEKQNIEEDIREVQQFIREHEACRSLRLGIESGIGKNEKETIISNSRAYAKLIRSHIYKEQNISFSKFIQNISKEAKEFILREFNRIELENPEIKNHVNFIKAKNEE